MHRAISPRFDPLTVLRLHDFARPLQCALVRGIARLGSQFGEPGLGILHCCFAQDGAVFH
ncbi:hypothetical protein [Azohydromonas aeria]|uniref:hypothetical protein n=1 Tax=Azohydromonas aeria TaxID=2590212 RepID=UPI0012F875D4|nr:hypothetical protein [Azohydromonas aeria]